MNFEEIFNFLDELRDMGSVNMFGAAGAIARRFNLDIQDARRAHTAWMETFSTAPASERAAEAVAREL